jgi:hypothetical protein
MSIEQLIFESALKNVPLPSSDNGLLVPYGTRVRVPVRLVPYHAGFLTQRFEYLKEEKKKKFIRRISSSQLMH